MLGIYQILEDRLLFDYAKGELSSFDEDQVSFLLASDLGLGERLERIYIILESSGWQPN